MRRLLPLLALLAALPARAQYLGYNGPEGLNLKFRTIGAADWAPEVISAHRAQIGKVGSGAALEQVSLLHHGLPLVVQVRTSDGWLPSVKGGEPTGTPGKAITGIRVTCERRAVRYRGAFVGKGVKDWARDGDAMEASGAPLEALDLEVLDAAPRTAKDFEYRVAFAGGGFGPWKKPGQAAEGTGEKAAMTAVEIRQGGDVKSEVSVARGGWGETTPAGAPAGDPTGKRGVVMAMRFFSDTPIRYRVKLEGSGWSSWYSNGATVDVPAGLPIQGLELDWVRAEP